MKSYTETVIQPGKSIAGYWRDLWCYRELLFFLSWRDILVRYKQTIIGILWSILRPILTMLVFTFVFAKVAGLSSGNTPYPILVFSAMLPWQFFATSLTECSNSLIENANMVSKIYFPRLIVPISSIVVSIVDFFISFAVLILLMIYYGYTPSVRIVMIPIFLVLAITSSLGPGILLASLNVKYRDFRYVIPFLVQFGLFVSPVGFSSAAVPEHWRPLYYLNPLVGVIDGFRWTIIRETAFPSSSWFLLSLAVNIGLFFVGIAYFRRTERMLADVI